MRKIFKVHIIITFLFSSMFVYSQIEEQKGNQSLENTNAIITDGLNRNFLHPQHDILIRQVEGVKFSYSPIQNGKNYIFIIENSSGNSINLIWDTKLFFSNENNSTEIHRDIIISPQETIKIYAIDSEKLLNQIQTKKSESISNIEIHNVKFKGLR